MSEVPTVSVLVDKWTRDGGGEGRGHIVSPRAQLVQMSNASDIIQSMVKDLVIVLDDRIMKQGQPCPVWSPHP